MFRKGGMLPLADTAAHLSLPAQARVPSLWLELRAERVFDYAAERDSEVQMARETQTRHVDCMLGRGRMG